MRKLKTFLKVSMAPMGRGNVIMITQQKNFGVISVKDVILELD
jgi:hypothetical protein